MLKYVKIVCPLFSKLIILISFFYYSGLKAQQKDSLLSLLHFSKEDTNKVNLYHSLYRRCLHTSKDSALLFSKEELALSQKINFKRGEMSSYSAMGTIQFQEGNYNEEIKNYLLCIKIAVELRNNERIAAFNNNIANVLTRNHEFTKALEYYKKSLELFSSLKNERGLATTNMNIGIVYEQQKEYNKALDYLFISLKTYKLLNDKKGILDTYNNIGVAYKEIDKAKSMEFFMLEIKLGEELKDEYCVETTKLNLGDLLNKMKKYKEALPFLESGLQYALKTEERDWELTAYLNLADSYTGLKDYEKANVYLYKHHRLNDFLFSNSKSQQIVELQIKYESEKKEKEIALLKEAENLSKSLAEKRKLYVVIAFISSLLFLSLFLLLVIRSKGRKKHQKLELAKNKAEFEQQAIRAQMNPHFIFNALNSIQSYILNNENQYAYDYLAKFSKLIRQVLINSQRNDITLKDELDLLRIYIELEHRRFKNRFEYIINCPDDLPIEEIKIPVMLIQPFVENAIWHGIMNLDKTIEGKLLIDFSLVNNILKITVEDNGVGREEAVKKKIDDEYKSIGMMFTQKRLDLLKVSGKQHARIEIIDLKNGNNKAIGTRVDIYITVND